MIRFGVDGEPDQAALERVVITDEKHRIRSQAAEEDSQTALAAHPIPVDARGGGALGADPNSREQILLSRGVCSLHCTLHEFNQVNWCIRCSG